MKTGFDFFSVLGTLLKSTSGINILKYDTNTSRRRRALANYIGFSVLYIILFVYCIIISLGYGVIGMGRSIPVLCSTVIIILSFMLTLIKTNGYMFGYKEYDILMSFPVSVRTIICTKFFYMYIKNLFWVLGISVAMLIGFAFSIDLKVSCLLMWTVGSLFISIPPTMLATALGSIIVAIGVRFKHKTLVQSLLSFGLFAFCISFRFVLEGLFPRQQSVSMMDEMSEGMALAKRIVPLSGYFTDAIINNDFIDFIILSFISCLSLAVFISALSPFYKKINSALLSGNVTKKYVWKRCKCNSILMTIVKKELRRFFSSTIYFTNVALGQVIVIFLAVASCFVNVWQLLEKQFGPINIDKSIIIGVVPFLTYLWVNITSSASASPSLEGKCLWVLKSMPVDFKDVVNGKALANLFISLPVGIAGTVILSISLRASWTLLIANTVMYVALSVYATALGVFCGFRFIRTDWENEVEVIKSGAAMGIYMLIFMVTSLLWTGLYLCFAWLIDGIVISYIISIVIFFVGCMIYKLVLRMNIV